MNELYELIERQVAGEATREEQMRLCELLQDKATRTMYVRHVTLMATVRGICKATDHESDEVTSMKGPDPVRRTIRWYPQLLALAASLVVVAGGVWWLSQRPDASLELRVAEVQGSWFRSQAVVTESPSHPITQSKATSPTPLSPGNILRPGDGVEVGANGYVKLAYPDTTQVELRKNTRMRVTIGAGMDKNAKRLALDSGMLVCSAAPQKKPIEIKTVHAMARVVGTRFSLGVTAVESTLAVQEGKVELCQGGKTLLVGVEETAVASGEGMKRLSPEAVWTRELLARADAGAWNALDFAKCVTHEKDAVWLVENPGEAGNRLWRTNPKLSNHVLFESARWKRGVVVGEVMLLPEENLPAPLAPPPSATSIPLAAPVWDWVLSDQRLGPKLLLYWDAPTEQSTSPSTSETRFYHRVSVPIAEPGVWCRFAMYFDTEAEEGAVALYRFWPAEGEQATADGNWIWRKLPITARNTAVGFGLMAHQVPVLWRELKLVPLGTDMPPPADRTRLTKGY
jgi:ferric-dicitrate binding protein FerR (iron transport regulator)